jgi:hypothetical protein
VSPSKEGEMPKKRGPAVRNRSAVTGRFVKGSYAKRHPNTTVTEKVKPRKKK